MLTSRIPFGCKSPLQYFYIFNLPFLLPFHCASIVVYLASSYFASELLFFQLNFRIPSALRNGIQVDSFPSPFRHVTSRQDPACGRPANNSLLRRGQLPNTPKSRKQHVHCHKHHILRRRRRQDSRGAFISPRPYLGRGDRWRRHWRRAGSSKTFTLPRTLKARSTALVPARFFSPNSARLLCSVTTPAQSQTLRGRVPRP